MLTQKGIQGWKRFLQQKVSQDILEKRRACPGNRYRPLSIATFAVEYELNNGLNPKMSHIINIFLYGLTCIILLLVLYQLIGNQNNKWYWSILSLHPFIFSSSHSYRSCSQYQREEMKSCHSFSLLMLYGKHEISGFWQNKMVIILAFKVTF